MFGSLIKEMSFKIFLFKALVAFCSAKQNGLFNFGRGHHDEYFLEIISKLD